MGHLLAMGVGNLYPLITVLVAVGLLFVEVILLAWRRNTTATVDETGAAKVKKRSRWLPTLFGFFCVLAFGAGLIAMHFSTLLTMFFGDQSVYDRHRSKLIIEELRAQETDNVKLLMLKELEVLVENPAND